jgi:hypothetical protein
LEKQKPLLPPLLRNPATLPHSAMSLGWQELVIDALVVIFSKLPLPDLGRWASLNLLLANQNQTICVPPLFCFV